MLTCFLSPDQMLIQSFQLVEIRAIQKHKEAFWTYMNEEVYFANPSAPGFILHFYGNPWAGPNIVRGDQRSQNRNGKMFQNFLE